MFHVVDTYAGQQVNIYTTRRDASKRARLLNSPNKSKRFSVHSSTSKQTAKPVPPAIVASDSRPSIFRRVAGWLAGNDIKRSALLNRVATLNHAGHVVDITLVDMIAAL